MQTIEQVFEDLNYPGLARLKKALKNRNIPFTNDEVERLVKGETVRQVQQAAPIFNGKVASHYLHYEWQADLIDWTTHPSKKGEKFILIVQDIFSRVIWAEALETKKPSEVLHAFKQIEQNIGQLPDRLTTDAGSEFTGVKRYLEEKGKKYRTKTGLRSLATLDNAIGNLKKALARDTRKNQTDDWASRLQKVIKGQITYQMRNI